MADLLDYYETIKPASVMSAEDQMALVTNNLEGSEIDANLGENLSIGQVQPALPVETE